MALDNIVSSTPLILSINNPYANGRVIVFADGSTKLVRDIVQYTPTEPDDYHTVKINDRITAIANFFYQGKVLLPSHHWWIIADANRKLIRNPLDLSHLKGKQLVIPNILNFKLSN
jgi:hypothetical protein